MNRKASVVVLLLSLLVAGYVVAGVVLNRDNSDEGPYRQMGVYTEVLEHINNDYVTQPNLAKVTDGALHGLLEALDPESSYLNPAQYQDFKRLQDKKGSANVGLLVSKRSGYANVIDVIPSGPAAQAGIARGDLIETVDGRNTREISAVEIRQLLTGDPGTKVALTVVHLHRSPEPESVSLNRVPLPPPAEQGQLYEETIGYTKVPDFASGRSQQIAAQIKSLADHGARKFILDLRDCGEGQYPEAEQTANLFLDHGIITYIEGQTYPRVTSSAEAGKAITHAPVVLLVNSGTAGPAEVLAGAILENARGDVIGTKTYGDASVQKVVEIGDGSALLLSVARYYTPTGKPIQEQAITPNIQQLENPGALPEDDFPVVGAPQPKEDLQLKRAVDVLKNRQTAGVNLDSSHPGSRHAADA